MTRDVLFGVVYIPPEGSPFENKDVFTELENSLLPLEHDGVCFLADFNARTGVVDGIITGGFKGTGPRRFGKKTNKKTTLFYVRSLCSINFCSGSVEMRQFKINCSGLKIDWGSPHGCSYLRNACYVITFCCFTQMFVDSAYKHDDGVVSCT